MGLLWLAGCVPVPNSEVCAGRTCSGGFVCDPATGHCVPPAAADAGTACAFDTDCGVASPRCNPATRSCVECLGDSDCRGGSCSGNLCERLPDSCATVGAAYDLSQGSVVIEGDTTRANGDVKLWCALAGAGARDVVYALSIPARKRLVASATAKSGSGLVPVLGLRSSCASTADLDQLGCASSGLGSLTTRLVVDPVQPGTVYLWVDGEAGTEGAFTLNLALEDTTAAESCSAPIFLVLNRPLLQLTGDTSLVGDDAAGTCGGGGGNDVVYAITIGSPKRVAFEVSSSISGFSPLLYLRTACDDPSPGKQLACVGGTAASARVDLPRLEPGTYYLWLDGQSGKSGSYALTINTYDPVPPPTNDTCGVAEVLPVPAGGVGTVLVQGDTTQAHADALGCGATGNDLVYFFTTTVPSGLEVKATPLSGSPLKPAVYLRGGAACASEAVTDQFGCAQATTVGGAATLAIPYLPAGSWALWVDGQGGSAGPFELKVDFKAPATPPANDTCAAPASIALAGAPVTVMGTTWGATDQNFGCEDPPGVFSPDVVYSLVVNSPQSVGIELRAEPGSSLKPVLTLRVPGTCGSGLVTDIQGCGWSDPQLSDRMLTTIPLLYPGTYPVWIEGDDGTQGAFSLRLSPGPALTGTPTNDTCSAPVALSQGVTASGDTRGATNDQIGACNLPVGANGEYAPDVVYKLTLATAQAVNLTVTPDAAEGQLFRPVLYLQGPGTTTCGGPGAIKGCQLAQSYGGTATLGLASLAAGTYFVWVDGAGLSGGKFTIRWQ